MDLVQFTQTFCTLDQVLDIPEGYWAYFPKTPEIFLTLFEMQQGKCKQSSYIVFCGLQCRPQGHRNFEPPVPVVGLPAVVATSSGMTFTPQGPGQRLQWWLFALWLRCVTMRQVKINTFHKNDQFYIIENNKNKLMIYFRKIIHELTFYILCEPCNTIVLENNTIICKEFI